MNCTSFVEAVLDAGRVSHTDTWAYPGEFVLRDPSSIAEWLQNKLTEWFGGLIDGINGLVNSLFTSAQRFFPRRDPLILDLDGDGIETIGADPVNPILFDHDGDGIKTGTGWVRPDDGFLVLDRNGNGTIDNGTELFGDSTPLSGGGNAADGFAALRDQDTNGDGLVDANDANFANLRLWRDLNQDGVSQANELSSLADHGIGALRAERRVYAQVLPNGNQLADLGNFVTLGGAEGTLGTVSNMADVNLADDTFHREFTDQIPITPEAEALPNMQGSGLLRALREAA
jgi:hypothetical protein